MILYDVKEDLMINLLEVQVNSNMMNHNQLGPIEQLIKIKLDINYLNWATEWVKSVWDPTSKRNIFITNKVDMKFVGCFIKNLNYEDNLIEIELTCDYHEIGGNFPKLKQIFRDKKIDQILN